MVICHCRAISDGLVRRAVAEGAIDVDAIIRRCGAGSVCGGCRPAIAELLGDVALEAAPILDAPVLGALVVDGSPVTLVPRRAA